MSRNQAILDMLGLARKAGFISAGSVAVGISIKKSQAKVVLVSKDLSARTKKDLLQNCSSKDIPCLDIDDRNELGQAIGKSGITVVSVNESKIAQKIVDLYWSENHTGQIQRRCSDGKIKSS